MDENNKVQLTEIYDVTDTNKRADLSTSDSSGDIKMQFDEWDEPTWLSHHTITDGMFLYRKFIWFQKTTPIKTRALQLVLHFISNIFSCYVLDPIIYMLNS